MAKSDTIIFWRRSVDDGEIKQKKIAWLESSGKFTGNEDLKKSIDEFIKQYSLDLTKEKDRGTLMSIFNGMYIFTTYAGSD